jgi:CRP/FNR family transcriptional regulator, cyclic AMP receptor protein
MQGDDMGWNILDISMLREVDLFLHVSDATLTEILSLASIDRHGPGEVIFCEGDVGDCFFVVLEGEVRISKDIHGVGEEALAFLKAGSYFGEMALVGEESSRSANAVCSERATLVRIKRADFLAFLGGSDAMSNEVLRSFVTTLSKRLRSSNDKVAFLALSSFFD